MIRIACGRENPTDNRTLRGQYESRGARHSGARTAAARRSGGLDTAESALASAAALIDRTGAAALAPALCEWRAELAESPR